MLTQEPSGVRIMCYHNAHKSILMSMLCTQQHSGVYVMHTAAYSFIQLKGLSSKLSFSYFTRNLFASNIRALRPLYCI